MQVCAARPAPTAREMVAAAVFKQAFIPSKLADIDHYERDLARAGHLHRRQQQTAHTAAYDDLLGVDDDDRTDLAQDDDFLYRKVIGENPEVDMQPGRLVPELLANDMDKSENES